MEKKFLTLLCLILLFGASSFSKATYTGSEKAVTKSTLLLQNLERQQANPMHTVSEETIQWTNTYGGTEDDTALSIIQTSNGGYVFAGSTGSWPNDNAWLVKIDTYGNVQWTQIYNFSSVNAVIPTADGGYALAGIQGGTLGSPSDAWLVKTDDHGVVQWNQTYDWKDHDEAESLIQTNDEGFILGGSSSDFDGDWNGWLVKMDINGKLLWNQTYGGLSHDYIHVIIQTVDGGFAFAGDTRSYGASIIDGWLVVTNAHGEMKWNRTYGGPGFDRVYSMLQMVDGGFALVGTTSSYGAGEYDAWLVKTDSNGTIEWIRTYGGPFHDNAYSGIMTADSGFALGGATNSYRVNSVTLDFWLVKLDINGVLQWNQTYGGEQDEECKSVIQTADGGFILAGRTRSFGAGGWDAWLIKTDAWGVAPDIYIPQRDWFVIGLLGSLALAAIMVIVLYVRGYWRLRKWP
ncbi:MAG: hypothetical protein ACE5R6_02885 [Candidatus Heimdallarchaeota archaeon]